MKTALIKFVRMADDSWSITRDGYDIGAIERERVDNVTTHGCGRETAGYGVTLDEPYRSEWFPARRAYEQTGHSAREAFEAAKQWARNHVTA